jgi:preprotein translocase subunit SecE
MKIFKSIARFFVNVKKEMKKVRWPKKKEMIKFSVATISIVFFFMVLFTCMDTIIALVEKVFS